MQEKMSNELRISFQKGYKSAIILNDSLIRIEHVLYGILTTNNIISEIISKKLEDFDVFINDIEDHNRSISEDIDPELRTEKVLNFEDSLKVLVKKCAQKSNDAITVNTFFMSCFDLDNQIIKIMNEYGITKSFMQRRLKQLTPTASTFPLDENFEKRYDGNNSNRQKSKTPVLDNFSRDLTILATEGKLDPVIGREAEVERVAQILTRRKKNNPVLIGDPGVGKTAIVEGLAIKIANNDCPRTLQGKRLVTLDLTSMVAGTKYRGQFEERIKALLDEVRDNDQVILFIDELHTMVGAGNSSGSLDAANVFKPALARGEIQCIGATTLDEYREHIEKDGALDRRFQKVMVNPPSITETRDILMNIKNKYEDYHKVTYTEDAVDEIVRLADRYITNREFPDKAIDILDEAGSRTHINIKPPQIIKDLQDEINEIKVEKQNVVKTQNFEKAADLRDKEKKLLTQLDKESGIWKKSLEIDRVVIDENMIADVVSSMTGIPVSRVSQNEIQRLLQIDTELKDSVIGQDEAIQKVASAIRRNRTGISRKSRPIGSFMFIGPSGVGKTELAKTLAEKIFGTQDALIRFDMSEFGEKFNVSKLIGSPPGYVGYEEGGQLTEKIKNKPYSLILFDEIEKAHPDVFNILLQLLDEGHLTDSSGRKINFKNTIVIMTSNIGIREVQDFGTKIGFSADGSEDDLKNANYIIEKALKKQFKPEFLNRLDDIIYFNYLKDESILKIIDIQLNDLEERLLESCYTLEIGKNVKEYVLKQGYDKNYGAREIQRTVQKYLEDPISEELLKEHMPKFAHITVGYDKKNDKLNIKITKT
jgi:ATP-dependent Clp protease ATP-binding subunit ClpC